MRKQEDIDLIDKVLQTLSTNRCIFPHVNSTFELVTRDYLHKLANDPRPFSALDGESIGLVESLIARLLRILQRGNDSGEITAVTPGGICAGQIEAARAHVDSISKQRASGFTAIL